MSAAHEVPEPSQARRQAQAAACRGRPPRRERHDGECDGQLDIDAVLADIEKERGVTV